MYETKAAAYPSEEAAVKASTGEVWIEAEVLDKNLFRLSDTIQELTARLYGVLRGEVSGLISQDIPNGTCSIHSRFIHANACITHQTNLLAELIDRLAI